MKHLRKVTLYAQFISVLPFPSGCLTKRLIEQFKQEMVLDNNDSGIPNVVLNRLNFIFIYF